MKEKINEREEEKKEGFTFIKFVKLNLLKFIGNDINLRQTFCLDCVSMHPIFFPALDPLFNISYSLFFFHDVCFGDIEI